MAPYDHILVPTDGSWTSERALRHAVTLAEMHDASLHAVYVLDTGVYTGLPMETAWEGVGDLLRSDAEDALERAVEIGDAAGLHVETHLVEGRPGSQIVRVAEEAECDLIVMGTRGRGGIDRLLLGSVAEKVVRTAPVPVTTLRTGATVGPEAEAEAVDEAEVDTGAEAEVDTGPRSIADGEAVADGEAEAGTRAGGG